MSKRSVNRQQILDEPFSEKKGGSARSGAQLSIGCPPSPPGTAHAKGEKKREAGGRSYKYILVELKLRIVSDEAGEARSPMPSCEQGRSRASPGANGDGPEGTNGGARKRV